MHKLDILKITAAESERGEGESFATITARNSIWIFPGNGEDKKEPHRLKIFNMTIYKNI